MSITPCGKSLLPVACAILLGLAGAGRAEPSDPIQVLLVTGAGNHDWKATTPVLRAALEQTGRFHVTVNEHPAELTAEQLRPFDVILSNYNVFRSKKGKALWSEQARKAYLDFVRNGKGHVVVHAGSSGFYDWPEYHKMVLSAWRLGQTGHGHQHAFPVRIDRPEHPITRGLQPFLMYDELWHKIPVPEGATVLLSAYSCSAFKGTDRWEANTLAGRYGKGRCFFTALGHDATKMTHPGFKALLCRGTEWAATGQVTLPAPKNLPTTVEQLQALGVMPADGKVAELPASWKSALASTATADPQARPAGDLRWQQDQDKQSLALLRGDQVIWQFHTNKKIGKPYFHPLRTPGGPVLTRINPPDHIWHYGLWFCWKYINGLNYWEENRQHVSQGRTDVLSADWLCRPDHSARIQLALAYHPPGQEPVMTEKRVIEISRPDDRGAYHLDWTCTFTAGPADVTLDRKPLPGEPNGASWGGYAGLSLRMVQNMNDRQALSTRGRLSFTGPSNYRGRAEAFEFSGVIDGKAYGLAICDHPDNLNAPTPIYAIASNVMNFISPAVLCLKPHVLPAGQSLTLRYRVIVHPGRWTAGQLKQAAADFAAGR